MSKYVPDILTRRWVVISSQRIKRPEDNYVHPEKNICVFCPGNERYTPGETFRLGKGEKNTPGWLVRVIPNKYPITDLHEVIIHSPNHNKDIDKLPLSQVALLIKTYRERFIFFKSKGQVLIFCNHGEHSGASLIHPHSQLVVIPFQINLDTLTREPINNLIFDHKYFYIYCPDFSQWPYEVWIAPKQEEKVFGEINDEEINSLAYILQSILQKLKKLSLKKKLTTDGFAYNYYIYPKENWYLRIIPRLVHRAGFELGTGLSVNIIDPKDAAEELKE
jgi:UDPglucose--hexose-1-phosphate uridylyltransferase